ncbi:MAG: N-acetylmuramoyl-L-alanine amidase-like domain-containing protein [Methanosarcinaceae archaeon]
MQSKIVLIFLVLILAGFFVWAFSNQPDKKLYYKMSLEAIDLDIRAVAEKGMNNREKMVYYSGRFMNAPYKLQCQGDGEYAKYEKWPLLNFKTLNCMTYCETVLGLALSDYYEEMFNILQHIRYRQGIIGMASRNHYTMADWLPANSWCLDDVSRLVAGDDTAELTRTISHQTFFRNKKIHDIPVYLPDRTVTIDYVPFEKLPEHETELKSGDIVALIMDRPAIFSAHMLMIIKKDGQTYFRHASMSAGKILDNLFTDYIAEKSKKPRYLGMSFMRVKEEINWQDENYTHGKFMLP